MAARWTWFFGIIALLAVINFVDRAWNKRPPDIVATKRRVLVDEVAGLPGNPRVFFDVDIDGKRVGRIEMELFASLCPKTCENFRCLCTGERGVGLSDVPLWFKGNVFHRVLPDFMCQAGDLTHLNGTGGESIYGQFFDDEYDDGYVSHDRSMLMSMANLGPEKPNTNSSQFFFTVFQAKHLDGKHVCFGRVTKGGGVVKRVEFCGTPVSGKPQKTIVIADCGELRY
ncbi:peptidyl-prolyl cis-trans isomerase [Aureococcus anophagefferens]|uniref:Peptidyl-prolyl cis-trans isomerase n=1 Tax=Aureococcus anophagefferens TaxID=44056 RepID=A0ABR1FMK8_AURAN|nr:peptidyl-prolyl cis-trans isomerase [Aureococcus anophagefferens]KAH8053461.1 peptidyl-prolyl cis-trans isomerase [Aureococcus anophagefferens]